MVTRMIMRLPFADTQCGFKAFTRPAAQTIFQLQQIERWGFDPEILFIALKRGYVVREVPVTWGHDERSRISYLKDGVQMLKELLLVRWNAITGVYRISEKCTRKYRRQMAKKERPKGRSFLFRGKLLRRQRWVTLNRPPLTFGLYHYPYALDRLLKAHRLRTYTAQPVMFHTMRRVTVTFRVEDKNSALSQIVERL